MASEEDIKTQIEHLFFKDCVVEKNRLDFAVSDKKGHALYWAESKKGLYDKWLMLAQLFLTIKPRIDKAELPPNFIGCFDARDITFVEFHNVQDVFQTNDFNWNERPSAVSLKTAAKVKRILNGKEITFRWGEDKDAVKEFIKRNLFRAFNDLLSYSGISGFIQITKNNFVQVFDRWSRDVLPSIAIPPEMLKHGIMPRDFYLADLLSEKNKTISDKLKILLNYDAYECQLEKGLFNKICFKDKGVAHKKFWNAYERPPKKEYRKYMLERQDLLVPSGIRERKGAYFTPQIWVEKSQEYLARVFGENWQDEYYIWDCCAGTGNMENGLTNIENVWASTLDDSDVRVMKENQRLLKNHVFQFDFLNDDFGKLPKKLQNIIADPEKQKKLIIYINPPYGECGQVKSGEDKNKAGISNLNKTHDKFSNFGKSLRELFALFLIRIKTEMPFSKIGLFSKLKMVTAPNFSKFRDNFQGRYCNGFVVHANTFDNVSGNFPIGFTIWDLSKNERIENISCDIIENNLEIVGKKFFYTPLKNTKFINDWISLYNFSENSIGYLNCKCNDFQHKKAVYIATSQSGMINGSPFLAISKNNLIQGCIYFSVRQCIEATWLNDRDQFLYPNDGWKTDEVFQNDCLIFTIFHSQNRIKSAQGTNHWIPFKPSEVNSDNDFDSSFMADFIRNRIFSPESKAVLGAGKTLMTYYHSESDSELNINASLYEIREYYRGRTDKGRLLSKSDDVQFQKLDDNLKSTLKKLAEKIVPKVYQYGFLKA